MRKPWAERPWTWREISEIEKERGPRFRWFVRKYGLRGQVALELSRKKKSTRDCAMGGLLSKLDTGDCTEMVESSCFQCALSDDGCTPWETMGRRNLIKWYAELVGELGLLPRERRA